MPSIYLAKLPQGFVSKIKTLAANSMGMLILIVNVSIYYALSGLGLNASSFGPWVNNVVQWVLWDPSLFIFKLQDMGISILSALYAGLHKDWQGLKQLVKTHLVVGVISELLKQIVRRPRPHGGDTKSFPSGHTSSAFTGAAFIHYRYGLRKAIPAYIGASIVGCVRVVKGAHYTSDVVAGAGIALLTGYNMILAKSAEPNSEVPAVAIERVKCALA